MVSWLALTRTLHLARHRSATAHRATQTMNKRTVYNFSAGPSCVDAGVLAKLGSELADFEGSGMVSKNQRFDAVLQTLLQQKKQCNDATQKKNV